MALQAYYKMNVGWMDASGNAYHGTNNGATIDTVNQKLGAGCGSYNGTNAYQSYTNFFDINNATQLSVDGWIKSDAGVTNKGIFGFWVGSSGFFIQSSAVVAADGLLVLAGGSNDYGEVQLDTQSDFIYFAMVYDGTLSGNANRLKLYVNNVQQSLTFGPGTIPTSLTGLAGAKPETGKIPSLVRYWDGLIDDQGFYDHAVDQDWMDYRWKEGVGQEIGNGVVVARSRLINLGGNLGGLTKATLNNLGGV